MLNGVMWNRQITRKNKLQIYNSIVKSSRTFGVKTRQFNNNLDGNELFQVIGKMFEIRNKYK